MRAINGTVKIKGDITDYISFGRGKIPLVLIPGLGDGLTTVKGKAAMGGLMFRPYAARFRVYMFSRKRELEPGADTASMAEDLAAVLDSLSLSDCYVAGVSQGGMIAQHLAARRPDLVKRLVLVVTVPRANHILRANVERWMTLARRGKGRQLMIDVTEQAHPERYLKKLRFSYPFMGLVSSVKDRERFLIQANSCLNHDATEVLDRIQAPTLVVAGDEDRTLGVEGSLELSRTIPDSRLCIFSGQGHAVYEDSSEFDRRVLSFLS